MSDTETPETKPPATYHLDRASKRTDAEREAHFEHWWAKQEPYRAAVIEAGGTVLTKDEARVLFMRRYLIPPAPAYLPPTPNIRRSA